MSPRQVIERRTSLVWGTYRWVAPNAHGEPPPRFGLVLRPPNESWVRMEISLFGRTFYLTWGRQA